MPRLPRAVEALMDLAEKRLAAHSGFTGFEAARPKLNDAIRYAAACDIRGLLKALKEAGVTEGMLRERAGSKGYIPADILARLGVDRRYLQDPWPAFDEAVDSIAALAEFLMEKKCGCRVGRRKTYTPAQKEAITEVTQEVPVGEVEVA